MDFKQLECFVKVIDKKSFSKASELLYMTQPAVTSNIQKLELFLDCKLINRNGKAISMTKEGEILYLYAIELIKLREKALHDVKFNKKNLIDNLKITASTIPSQYILPKIVSNFKKEFKDLKIDLSVGSSRDVIEDVLAGKINIGFVGSEYKNKSLEYIDFFDDELVMIISKDIQFYNKEISLKEIGKFDIFVRKEGSGTRSILENALNNIGKTLSFFKSVNEVQSCQFIKSIVELGGGIGFVSKLDIKNEIKLGLLNSYKVKELKLNRKFKMVYAKDRHFSPAEIAFKDFIIKK